MNKSKSRAKAQQKKKAVAQAKPKLPSVKCNLSDTACRYLETLSNAVDGPLVGIPDGSVVLSGKYRTWSRGVLVTGVAGNQDIAVRFSPAGLFDSSSWVVGSAVTNSGNQPAVTYTTNGSNAPFSSTSFGSGRLTARLVAAKFRIRYTGTELNRGGVITGLQEPNHSNLDGVTVAQMLSYPSCKRVSINAMRQGEWFELDYTPVDLADTYFIDTVIAGSYLSEGTTVFNVSKPFIVAYIQNPTVGTPFEYEAWGVVEYTGPQVPNKTPTMPDSQGFHAVVSSFAIAAEHHYARSDRVAGMTSTGSFLGTVAEIASNVISMSLPYVREYAGDVMKSSARSSVESFMRLSGFSGLGYLPTVAGRQRPLIPQVTLPGVNLWLKDKFSDGNQVYTDRETGKVYLFDRHNKPATSDNPMYSPFSDLSGREITFYDKVMGRTSPSQGSGN